MSNPGFTRPDLRSICAADGQAEPAGAVSVGLSADGHPLAGNYPPEPLASGIDRAIRLSTAAAVLAVAGIAAYVSYGHAYTVVRAHGETGITVRLEPTTIDGLVYASSMVVLYAARHRVPVPLLARWLLALGIAATLMANMAQGWPGLSMTRRWPRTGSACRPATAVGTPARLDVRTHIPPLREPESPRHDKRRHQTRRTSRSRPTRKQGPPAVSADAVVTAPGGSGIGAATVRHDARPAAHPGHQCDLSGPDE